MNEFDKWLTDTATRCGNKNQLEHENRMLRQLLAQLIIESGYDRWVLAVPNPVHRLFEVDGKPVDHGTRIELWVKDE